jgi:hypothetical protein
VDESHPVNIADLCRKWIKIATKIVMGCLRERHFGDCTDKSAKSLIYDLFFLSPADTS